MLDSSRLNKSDAAMTESWIGGHVLCYSPWFLMKKCLHVHTERHKLQSKTHCGLISAVNAKYFTVSDLFFSPCLYVNKNRCLERYVSCGFKPVMF